MAKPVGSLQGKGSFSRSEGCLGPFLIIIFNLTALCVGSYFPNQELNPQPLLWKHGVLTTGPQGKSQENTIILIYSSLNPWSHSFKNKNLNCTSGTYEKEADARLSL